MPFRFSKNSSQPLCTARAEPSPTHSAKATPIEPKATQAEKLIDAAMDKVIAEAKHLTADLGGKAGTTEMGDAVAAAI